MKVTPFMLIGASVLASVESSMALAVRGWAGDWGIAPDALSVRARRASECPAAKAPGAWSCIGAQERHVYMAWHPGCAAALQALMFAPDSSHALPKVHAPRLAPAAGSKAQDALSAALAGAAIPAARGTAAVAQAPDAGLYARGAGAVMFDIAIGPQRSQLLLDEPAIRALCGHAAVPDLPALAGVDFPRALADTEVALDLTIGAARVGLSSLMSLAPGDVIRLDTSVEQPVALRLPSGTAVLNGYMGKRGDQVAVELTRSN